MWRMYCEYCAVLAVCLQQINVKLNEARELYIFVSNSSLQAT
jgi:hypothetical protein